MFEVLHYRPAFKSPKNTPFAAPLPGHLRRLKGDSTRSIPIAIKTTEGFVQPRLNAGRWASQENLVVRLVIKAYFIQYPIEILINVVSP